jgi:hypothetical protein
MHFVIEASRHGKPIAAMDPERQGYRCSFI